MKITDPVNFWAVGVNCCDNRLFRCGDVEITKNNPTGAKKTAIVLPRSHDIEPFSGLAGYMNNASRYEHYEGALLLRWTQNPTRYVEQLWNAALEHAFNAIAMFSFVMALFALKLAPDAEIPKNLFDPFNLKEAFKFRKQRM